MPKAPHPANEDARVRSLKRYEILDTLPEREYDDIVKIAASICGTPIALVSLVDGERQWFKSKVGIDATETSRDLAFCAHAILTPDETLVVSDATCDERFSDNPLVLEDPSIRFYAGAPLVTPDGAALGTLCVIDSKPRVLNEEQREILEALSRQVSTVLGLRLSLLESREHQRRMQEATLRLEAANRQLDDFCHIASHDLKEPLRGLRHYSQFLIEDYGAELGQAGVGQLEVLAKLTDRMEHMVDSLLEYSKAGRGQESKADVNTQQVVERVLESLQFSIDDTQTEVRVAATLPVVHGYEVAIAEVFRNLVTNALKYNDKANRWIEIGFETGTESGEPGDGRFYVRDNGIGIDSANQAAIFDVFRRLHSGNEYGGGAGAGLAIVTKLVESLGGDITVESEPGEGTTFWFHGGSHVGEVVSEVCVA